MCARQRLPRSELRLELAGWAMLALVERKDKMEVIDARLPRNSNTDPEVFAVRCELKV